MSEVQPDVRDHIPLEQGLRPTNSSSGNKYKLCQRPYSIRTRIKTALVAASANADDVRDHIPLEQGLRLSIRVILASYSQSETIFH